jgi:ubiquinone/menaquinone biosynthesis C-methylase UbiE
MPGSKQVLSGWVRPCLLAFCTVLVGSGLQAQDKEEREQWQQPDRVMADLHVRPGMRIADVGCGSGYFTFRLARAVGPKGKVFALDVSSDVLKPLRERVERERLGSVEVLQSEPAKTGLRPVSLDAALVCLVLHEASPGDRSPLIRDVAQALKPGGFLFIIDHRKSHEVKFDPYEKLIPREDLVKLGTDAGLVLDAEFHYLKYQVFLRFRKPPAAKAERSPAP